MRVLRDLLAPDLAIVFCGTAVGTASARRGAYYAGPGNAFWPTLFAVGLTPRRLEPEEYARITEYGLGLTDLAKTVAGSDSSLSAEHFDCGGLRAKIRKYRPRLLAFTSKRAAEEFVRHPVGYGLLPDTIGETALFILPSPSGAARRYWCDKPWRELAHLRRADDRHCNSNLAGEHMSRPVYALNLFDVSNKEEYMAYSRRSAKEVQAHGGRVLALGKFRESATEGVEPRAVLILVEWESKEAFDSYRDDPALSDLHPHRTKGTRNYIWHLFDKLEDLRPILK